MDEKQGISEIPQPYHRWLKNEDPYFDTRRKPDHCIVCGIVRNPLGEQYRELASAACPQRDYADVWADEIRAERIRKDMGR